LSTVSKLMAPVAPFFSEWLYRNLNEATGNDASQSVHLSLIENGNNDMIDKSLEERMDYAQRISSLVLSLRKKEKIRVRQPLQKVLMPVLNDEFKTQVKAIEDLVLAEVNVKSFEYVDDASGVIKKKIKPNFKTLGKRLGKHMKAGAAIISQLGNDDIVEIEKTNSYSLQLEGEQFDLSLEDFEIVSEDIPGWQVASDKTVSIFKLKIMNLFELQLINFQIIYVRKYWQMH